MSIEQVVALLAIGVFFVGLIVYRNKKDRQGKGKTPSMPAPR